MGLNWFLDIHHIYISTCFVLSIGLFIGALEDLKAFHVFKYDGLLSWNVSRLMLPWVCKGFFSRFVNLILNDTGFKLTIYLKIIFSSLLLVLSIMHIVSPLLICSLFFLNLLMLVRSPYSLDGAFQMNIMVLLGMSLGSVFGLDSNPAKLSVYFITFQLVCSYFISGFIKILSPVWRKSYAMHGIFSTNIYGHPFAFNFVNKHEILAKMICWSILLFEIFFFMSLFFNPQVGIFFLLCGLIFHFAIAVFMGLNSFLFAFLAAYPSFIYVSMLLNNR